MSDFEVMAAKAAAGLRDEAEQQRKFPRFFYPTNNSAEGVVFFRQDSESRIVDVYEDGRQVEWQEIPIDIENRYSQMSEQEAMLTLLRNGRSQFFVPDSPLPSPAENPSGLHQKYLITRTDGKPVDPNGIYFVLRLDGDHLHNLASRRAARQWVTEVLKQDEGKLSQTARELSELIRKIDPPKGFVFEDNGEEIERRYSEGDYGDEGAFESSDSSAEVKKCPKCNDTGSMDSGGVTPWGAGIDVPCDLCSDPPAPAPSPAVTIDPPIKRGGPQIIPPGTPFIMNLSDEQPVAVPVEDAWKFCWPKFYIHRDPSAKWFIRRNEDGTRTDVSAVPTIHGPQRTSEDRIWNPHAEKFVESGEWLQVKEWKAMARVTDGLTLKVEKGNCQ